MMISRTGNKGILLIELSLSIIILLTILMLVWPVLNQLTRNIELENICKNINYTFRYTRDLALNESRNYMIEFNENKYVIKFEKDPLNNPNEFELLEDNLKTKRSWSTKIKIRYISDNKIIFRPNGSSENFSISLENEKGDICTIKLNGLTGRCEIIKA